MWYYESVQIIFQKAAVDDGVSGVSITYKKLGDDYVIRRPNSLAGGKKAGAAAAPVGKPGAGGTRASTGAGGKGGGGKIEGLDYSTGAGVQMGSSAMTRTAGGNSLSTRVCRRRMSG